MASHPRRRPQGSLPSMELRIEWQRLVEGGQTCPRCADTGDQVSQAVQTLDAALAPLGISVRLREAAIALARFQLSHRLANIVEGPAKPISPMTADKKRVTTAVLPFLPEINLLKPLKPLTGVLLPISVSHSLPSVCPDSASSSRKSSKLLFSEVELASSAFPRADCSLAFNSAAGGLRTNLGLELPLVSLPVVSIFAILCKHYSISGKYRHLNS